jgi:hypothetical protein
MKKILISLFQVAVTVGMLIWVFHDPNQRAKMAIALRMADYRWVGAGVLAYIVVEIAAAVRWQILLRVQNIRLSMPRVAGLLPICGIGGSSGRSSSVPVGSGSTSAGSASQGSGVFDFRGLYFFGLGTGKGYSRASNSARPSA